MARLFVESIFGNPPARVGHLVRRRAILALARDLART
jgi:hypothetical protein